MFFSQTNKKIDYLWERFLFCKLMFRKSFGIIACLIDHLSLSIYIYILSLYIFQVFTSIFTFECIIKLMALSKEFFLCGWNIFDLIIVTASLLDIIFELVDGLSVLRGLRLVRTNESFFCFIFIFVCHSFIFDEKKNF